jgi:TolB protein
VTARVRRVWHWLALLAAVAVSGCGAPGVGGGGEIVYAGSVNYEYPTENVSEIFVMDGDGSNQRQLTDLGERQPAARLWHRRADLADPVLSPDGRRIAFHALADAGSNREIYVMDADGGNKTRVTTRDGFDGYPAFSPDGQRIAFVSLRRVNDDYETDIFVMDADGSNELRVNASSA